METHLAPAPAEASDDLELVEMVNLPSKYTAVDGTIFISTAQGAHAPRVKWYPGRPHRDAPCLSVTVAQLPDVANHGLPPRIASAAADPVISWVALNHAALLDFWRDGASWTIDEVNAFITGLKPLR